MKTIGVILAGGNGERFGALKPKQFVKLAGREIIEYTIDVFQESPYINEIVVVSNQGFQDHIWALSQKNNWTKLSRVLAGGADRMASTESAVSAFAGEDGQTKLLFHDAVRPLLDKDIIRRCVVALNDFGAVDAVISSSDTLVAVEDNGCIANIPARAFMRRGQTPQGFQLSVIREALKRAAQSGRRDFTCDCGIVRAMTPVVRIMTVEGSEANIKITTPLDLFLAEKLIQTLSLRIDGERLAAIDGKNIVIFGGNSGIGKSVHDLALLNGARVYVASRTSNGVDVADGDAVEAFLAETAERAGQIDAVINSAGILIRRPFAQMDQKEIDLLIGTNFVGAINVARSSRAHLAASHGALINFTSSSYTRGRAQYGVYSSTKCAVVNLTQALAEEWGDQSIRVNCINPERTNTPMRLHSFGKEEPGTLLDPQLVARYALAAVIAECSGVVVDVRLAKSGTGKHEFDAMI